MRNILEILRINVKYAVFVLHLEFAPVNLHLQRMWAYNDTLKRDGFLDIITVGAFTRHNGKSKTGGLIKYVVQSKLSHPISDVEFFLKANVLFTDFYN